MYELFTIVLLNPILNILLVIYHGLAYLGIPYALGFAVILLTIVIRFLLYPLTSSQLKASKKMQEVAPHVSKLKEQHKNDAQKLQKATMDLYKEHGINPAAGCLPILLQLPILWALYTVLQKVVELKPKETIAYINQIVYHPSLALSQIWDTTFFGISLGQSPSKLLEVYGPIVLLLPVLTGAFQFIQTKMMLPDAPKTPKDAKKKDGAEDFATAFQAQSTYIFPAMIGFFSYSFPFGLTLYWNTLTIFGIIQQYKLHGWGGAARLFSKKPQAAEAVVAAKPKVTVKKKAKQYGRK